MMTPHTHWDQDKGFVFKFYCKIDQQDAGRGSLAGAQLDIMEPCIFPKFCKVNDRGKRGICGQEKSQE